MTLRADEIAHSDRSDLDRVWERLTRPIPDGAIAGDTAEWTAASSRSRRRLSTAARECRGGMPGEMPSDLAPADVATAVYEILTDMIAKRRSGLAAAFLPRHV